MLRFQASLPHLPVPSLASTGTKYLESVRPHLSDAEFKSTEAIVHAFVASPQSAQLQHRLQDHAAQPGMQNWLADWWNEAAYMGYRDPVVVNVSYFFVHLDDKRRRDPAKRASALIKATMLFRDITER
jgi:carnitine O-acetyltransferase